MVTIPTAASFDSLNLSQAVLLLVSHLFMALRNPVVEAPLDMPAPYEEVLGFFDHLETALETHGYFRVHQKKQRMIRTIRSLFIRAQMSHQEVQTMRGVVESLINPNGIYSRPRRRKMIFSPDLMIKALTNSQD
jgi:tRNA/rRNA methyltransferase